MTELNRIILSSVKDNSRILLIALSRDLVSFLRLNRSPVLHSISF